MAHLLPPAGVTSHKTEAFMFSTVKADDFFRRPQSAVPPNIHDYRWTDYKLVDRKCKENDNAFEEAKIAKSYCKRIPRSEFNPAGRCPSTVQEQWYKSPCPCPKYRGVGGQGGKGCACMGDSRSHHSSRAPGREMFDRRQSGGQGEGISWPRSTQPSVSGPTSPGGHYSLGGHGDGIGVHAGGSLHKPPPGKGRYCPPVGIDPRCLVQPRNKVIPNSTRPTGDPYFTHESKPSCVGPFEAPRPLKGGFSFDDWLRTAPQREPPEAWKGMCIPTLFHWCGGSGTQAMHPLEYAVAKIYR